MIKPYKNKLNIISSKYYDRLWFFNELTFNSNITKDKYYSLMSLLTLENSDIILDLTPRDYVKESIELSFNISKLLGDDTTINLLKELPLMYSKHINTGWLQNDIHSLLRDYPEENIKEFLTILKLFGMEETLNQPTDKPIDLTVKEFLELKDEVLNNEELKKYLVNKYVESLITILSVKRPMNFEFEISDTLKIYLEYYEDMPFEEIETLETKENSLGYLEELTTLLHSKGSILLGTLQSVKLTSGFCYTIEPCDVTVKTDYNYKGLPELINGFKFHKCAENEKLRMFEITSTVKLGEPIVNVNLHPITGSHSNKRSSLYPYENCLIPSIYSPMDQVETIHYVLYGNPTIDGFEEKFLKGLKECETEYNYFRELELPKVFRGKTEKELENKEQPELEFYLNYHTTKLADGEYLNIQAELIQENDELIEKALMFREAIVDYAIYAVEEFVENLTETLELDERDIPTELKSYYKKIISEYCNFTVNDQWEYGNFYEEVAKKIISKTEEMKEGFTETLLDNIISTLLEELECEVRLTNIDANGEEDKEDYLKPYLKLNYLLADTDSRFFENIFLKEIIKAYFSKKVFNTISDYYSKGAYTEEEYKELLQSIESSLSEYGYNIPTSNYLNEQYIHDFELILIYLHQVFFNTLSPFLTEFYNNLSGKAEQFQEMLKEEYSIVPIMEHWTNLYNNLENIVEGEQDE